MTKVIIGKLFGDRPISCVYDKTHKMFRVLRASGKSLSSGGFGVTISTTSDSTEGSSSDNEPNQFLFVEEVVFLHERGLLECRTTSVVPLKSVSGDLANWNNTLDASQLYQWLPKLGVSLPMYLVYAHLQSQDFRVLRHAPERLALLQAQERGKMQSLESDSHSELPQHDTKVVDQGSFMKRKHDALGSSSSTEEGEATLLSGKQRELRLKVRQSVRSAPPPQIPAFDKEAASTSSASGGLNICWDCYQPNALFGKTHPGIPDFYVAVTFYNESQVRFSDLRSLPDQGIPIKIATVSDSGTVLMFGLSPLGPPGIRENTEETKATTESNDKGTVDAAKNKTDDV